MKPLRFTLLSTTAAFIAAVGTFACATSDSSDAKPVTRPDTIPSSDGSATDSTSDAGSDDAEAGCAPDAGCLTASDCSSVDLCAVDFPVSRSITLNAVWGTGPNDFWMVGTRGTLLHGDGTSLTPLPSGTSDVFFAIWGTGPRDVWALSGTSPMHSHGFADGSATFEAVQGSTWNPWQTGTGHLWAGASLGPEQVWIGADPTGRFDLYGGTGSLFRLGLDENGSSVWSTGSTCSYEQTCNPQIHGLWGASISTMWAVGQRGQTFLLDDADAGHWAYRGSVTSWDLEGIWGSSANDVWAVGGNGTIIHSSGTSSDWTQEASPTTKTLHAVWGSSPSDVWAVGDDATVVHYDGVAWKLALAGLPEGDVPRRLFGVWGSGPDDVWVVGEGLILHRSATSRRHR